MFGLYFFVVTAVAGLTATDARIALSFDHVMHKVAERATHVQARRAFQQGKIRSLGDIMAMVRPELAGEIIEVELETQAGAYFYNFKVLTPKGRLTEVTVDAANGKVLKKEAED
jgi:uncharacterized membrane protein YkoI